MLLIINIIYKYPIYKRTDKKPSTHFTSALTELLDDGVAKQLIKNKSWKQLISLESPLLYRPYYEEDWIREICEM